MEPTRTYSWRLRLLISITLILLFSFILSPSVSAINEGVQERTRTLGSRPPGCVNRCMNCQPCRATLVIPPHHKNKIIDYRSQSSHREDDCYYLLSWKCKCGDKLFQP